MNPLLQVFAVACIAVSCAQPAPPDATVAAPADTTWLFDDHSFAGWNGVNAFFRIEDGAIVAGSMERPIPRNEFLCTDARYRDFRLHFRTKLVGEQTNAGVQFRTERIPGSNEVVGYQADIGIGWWGSLYDESRRNRILARADSNVIARVLRPFDWNDYRVEAVGDEITLFINGARTAHYVETDTTLNDDGHICLQIHSGPPGEVWYSSIWIEPLGATR